MRLRLTDRGWTYGLSWSRVVRGQSVLSHPPLPQPGAVDLSTGHGSWRGSLFSLVSLVPPHWIMLGPCGVEPWSYNMLSSILNLGCNISLRGGFSWKPVDYMSKKMLIGVKMKNYEIPWSNLTLDNEWALEEVSFLKNYLSRVNLWTKVVNYVFGGLLKDFRYKHPCVKHLKHVKIC